MTSEINGLVPTYTIIEGSLDWANKCREFCRTAYLAAYERPELGITKDLFSKDIFSSPRIKAYFQDICRNTDDNKTWLTIDPTQNLLGMVGAHRYPDYCDMKAFYVKPELKGQGIGRVLYERVLAFAGSQPIQVDVIEYADEAIELYKHWGFVVDQSKGTLIYPIVEWPEAARQAYRAIYMVRPGVQ